MKIVTVVGARPQFIKAAPLSRAFADAGLDEYLVHTGQHYDEGMSALFFEELGVTPDIDLGVGSGPRSQQVGEIVTRLERVLTEQDPECVVVPGDTNSTLGGAIAASRRSIPIAHVEAGLRSHNRGMAEERNRILVDHCASLLFCPSDNAAANLAGEEIARGIHVVGDVMADALQGFRGRGDPDLLRRLGAASGAYMLLTIHRQENADDPRRLQAIFSALSTVDERVIFPAHPRTRKSIESMELPANVTILEPLGYADMILLEESARVVVTDSGGMQKEAYWLGVPCVTLREETEWRETVELGWNVLTGADPARIAQAVLDARNGPEHPPLYGDGHAAERCAEALTTMLSRAPAAPGRRSAPN